MADTRTIESFQAALEADLHDGVSLSEIVARGGWAVDGVQRVFPYVTQNFGGDTKCARALFEWPNLSEGELLTNVLCINVEGDTVHLYSDLYLCILIRGQQQH